jgi:ribosomal protein S13
MTDDKDKDLFQDGQIRKEVLALWEIVFRASNEIIRQSGFYSILTIGDIPDPNIHKILKALKVVDDILDEVLSDIGDSIEADAIDCIRLIQNSKKQVSTLENLALSVRLNDESAYQEHLACLKQQAAF